MNRRKKKRPKGRLFHQRIGLYRVGGRLRYFRVEIDGRFLVTRQVEYGTVDRRGLPGAVITGPRSQDRLEARVERTSKEASAVR